MFYHFIAAQSDGRVIEGDIEAATPNEVLLELSKKGLRPISLKAVKAVESLGGRRIFGHSITVDDKVFLTKYLALMLRVGTDLFRAIDILIADFDKPTVKALLIEIRSTLERGQPFFVTFSKYPRYFSSVFVNLIKAGESSGNLVEVFEELSVSLQKEKELRQKIKSALTYPIILISLALLMLFGLVVFALPRIAQFFKTSSVKPPVFSQIVFATGDFLNYYILYIILGAIIGGVGFWYAFTQMVSGRRFMRRFFAKMPFIKNILRQIALQRFAGTLGSLLKAGLPILDGLEITADAVGDENLKDALLRISREGIAKGLGIGEAFRRESAFPRIVVNLMAVSEKAGHSEDVLHTLSSFYESEIESEIKILLSFLEPILLLGIGAIIGVIALAVIVPIYQLVGQFQ